MLITIPLILKTNKLIPDGGYIVHTPYPDPIEFQMEHLIREEQVRIRADLEYPYPENNK